METISVDFDTSDLASYQKFLKLRGLPIYWWHGRRAIVPVEYAGLLGESVKGSSDVEDYDPHASMFDYQRDITRLALNRRRFAVFAECGLGKTMIQLEFARYVSRLGPVLIIAPLMVVPQFIQEAESFYDDELVPTQILAKDLADWLETGEGIGITNWESLRGEFSGSRLAGLLLDESSMLKSHYGKFGRAAIQLGKGVEYKMASTGTPAPNDRIEYANHSVFLDIHRTTNEFLAKYFVNRGKTSERWELKQHALKSFYGDLSHWCIFLSDPSVYGWKDNVNSIPPIRVHIETVELTADQRTAAQSLTGDLFTRAAGGIAQRGKLGQIAKGHLDGRPIATNKPQYIAERIDSWKDRESTLVWCIYNEEQKLLHEIMPDAGSITGTTSMDRRLELIDAFKSGELRTLISKPKILGFGLNLQKATRQVFSGIQDSYELFYQAVKRSNRVGSTKPLDVHIPATEIEEPMIANVLRKADRIDSDTREQEMLFKERRIAY